MKQIAMVLIFSIILVTNTQTALVAPNEESSLQNMRKLVVYEQPMTGHNPQPRKANEISPTASDSNKNGNLCTLDEETPSQTKVIDEKSAISNIISNNNREQSLHEDEAEAFSQINEITPTLTDRIVRNEHVQHMIPDEAIRLRILAHSDTPTDQHIKKVVRNRVNEHIQKKVALIDKIDIARTVIEDAIPTLEAIIAETLVEYDEQYSYKVAFETNVPFPLKTYGSYVYPAGDYEAILITLGDGIGENWWCVLFPPLCFIDFFNSATVVDAEDTSHDESTDELSDTESENIDDDVEVRFFLLDLFNFS